MVLKLDMENAFDRVKHSFLFKVLNKYGFSVEFIDWIKACIGSPWIAPMINGRSTQFFKTSRGLRQGFPLSPSLYILMADSLSQNLRRNVEWGASPDFKSLQVLKKSIIHNFLMTLFYLELLPYHSQKIQVGVGQFLAASGGKINNKKRRIYGWNISGHHQDIISKIFGFPMIVNWKSFKYLGMPIFHNIASSQDWKTILDKLTSRIQSWGAHWLNPTSKIVLIKSILSALTIFQCAGLMAPKGILEKISRSL
jgi:hypothetical protein